ncbi:hypothetical protein G9A89_007403 [Geosiphon pyriformis]|nr:hypothetical protein G9A89_007403 [Geosiphon pyriformis]
MSQISEIAHFLKEVFWFFICSYLLFCLVFTISQLTNPFVVPLVSDAVNAMSTKKLAKSAATNSVSGSLRQKPKVSLGKIKHSGDKTDLTYKLPASVSS